MSALSTPGGGGTTAQSKPTSGKQKFQKLDINSLYCANKNENSEPSSVKSQLSRKHGMQSLGKVPSARRPPANLPSLKTEIGQDPNANSTSAVTTVVSVPTTCTTQTTTATPNNNAAVGPGGWVSLPPPSSPHFRTEFPSLEAAAQPSHRAADHTGPQPQLRPQTEGSWTCGGAASGRQESGPAPATAAAAPATVPASQQTPAFRAILPSFLMKGSNGGGGLGLGGLGALRERGGGSGSAPQRDRGPARAPPTPRAVEVLTARPILRDEQISSLDDISRDAGWAQHDDIDYDQKLDFSDGESSAPTKGSNKSSSTRASIENDRTDIKMHDLGDEDQMWAERRQKQNNEVAQAVARARQRKEEEQRRQLRDVPSSTSQPPKEFRVERERIESRERDLDPRDKDRVDNKNRDRIDRDRDRIDKDKERNESREWDTRDKDRMLDSRDRDRMDNRERFDNRDRDLKSDRERDARSDRDHEHRDRDRGENRDRGRMDNRDRHENEKERGDVRERNDRDRTDRDRFDRERERDRDRDRDRDAGRDRNDRDREFRERNDRDYGRDRDQNNPAFSSSKVFQANIPPRFLKQQQNRQQDDPKAGWAFSGKPAPRRQDIQQPFSAPRHAQHNNGRRSYSRDYSDREEAFRRDKEGSGPQWRSEMQDFERFGRDLERSNSKESYKEYSDYKDKRNECDKKSTENIVETNSRSAAEKLSEVFERKSIGISDSISSDSLVQAPVSVKQSSPIPPSQRESLEREFSKTSWADAVQDEQLNMGTLKPLEKVPIQKDSDKQIRDLSKTEYDDSNHSVPLTKNLSQQSLTINKGNITPATSQTQSQKTEISSSNNQNLAYNQVLSQPGSLANSQAVPNNNQAQVSFPEQQSVLKPLFSAVSKQNSQNDNHHNPSLTLPTPKQIPDQQQQVVKPKLLPQKTEKESELESVVSKSSIDPTIKYNETHHAESLPETSDIAKCSADEKKNERFSNEHIKMSNKEPIERKSSGSGSEKKMRGYGGSGGYAVYNRGWGPRDNRGRRSHRSSRSNNRASESDGSTDGTLNSERRERRRAPRSPRGPKKSDKPDEINATARDPTQPPNDVVENREPFAPRGQPSRRGRGGFQGSSRPPAPAKRVVGYGPPNTKSPFSQANRAVKETEEVKDNTQMDDKGKTNKPRTGSSSGRGRDRRPKGAPSGEDENWETTSEHSEGGVGASGRRRSAQSQKNTRNTNSSNRQNGRSQGGKKEIVDNKTTTEITEAISDLKLSVKKEDEVVDDGFQEVRNKKSSKETRPVKEDSQSSGKQSRSHSNQGNGRNQSSSRNSNDKSANRNSAPVAGKSGSQYDRPRQANLAPRFVKQRQQRQQVGLVSACGPDTGAAPPPPPVNAWDKPISQTLRGNVEENVEVVDNKSAQSSQRSTPAETSTEIKTVSTPCSLSTDKSSMLDGATPPVETIIFENTNYKTATPDEALQPKYQINQTVPKPQVEEVTPEIDNHTLTFNGEVRSRPRSIQELMAESGRQSVEGDTTTLGLQMSFDSTQKTEDSDMKLDFGFDSDLGQLSEDKSAKSLGLPRGVHMSTSNTISPLAADLNLKIASVKKVWEMPAVAENTEELQFTGFEEPNTESAPPNVCKVKPTQQLQSPPPQHYNHVGYQGGYGGLSVPSPPAMLFNSSQQLLGSSQQLPQQGGLYGAFLDQSRGQFGGFPGTPYGAGSAAPYNYQPPPDMFSSIPSQYRMAAGGGAAFGQSGQLGNSPSTVLISSTSNSLMSATVKPTTQQIGAIGAGSKGGGVGGVGGVNTYGQQYLGYSGPVGEAPYSLLPRPAPPASSYYTPYQPPTAPAPTYPLQFTQPAQSGAFGSQFLSSQLQVAAAVQQMQQQYRAPLQQQYPPPQPQQRMPPQQQLKSPLHEHANGFAPLCDAASPTPKGCGKPQKPPHSPPQHKYLAPPQHPPPAHTPHQHHQQQMVSGGGNTVRCVGGGGGGGVMARGGGGAPRYPAPIQRPHAPAMPLYRAPQQRPHQPRPNLYYNHPHRNGGGGPERAPSATEASGGGSGTGDDGGETTQAAEVQPPPELKAE